MSEWLKKLSTSFPKRTVIMALGTLVIVLGALYGLRFVSFDNNIEQMLPHQEEIRRSMKFLRESNLSDKVVLSFRLTDTAHSTDDLIRVVDQFAGDLKSPLIRKAVTGLEGHADPMSQAQDFLEYAPLLFDEEAQALAVTQMEPKNMEDRLRGQYQALLSPAGMFVSPWIRSDPLGLKTGMLKKLEQEGRESGYQVQMKEGHLISRDGTHAMMVLETSVAMTDGFGARQLTGYLQEHLKALPDFVSADIIGGHLHTVSNEDVIKRDIRVTLTLVSIAFVLLFLFFVKDIRAILIFLIPFLSMLVTVPLCGVWFRKLSYVVIGVGAVVAGIAVDYGIHVYVALRSARDPKAALREIMVPLAGCALTTIAAFATVFLSSVEGYHQLAVFAILNILFCLGYSLFVLPSFLKYEGARGSLSGKKQVLGLKPLSPSFRVAVWAVCLTGAALLLPQVVFRNDVSQLDGTSRDILRAEESFQKVWGDGSHPGILVVQGKDFESAQERYEEIARKAALLLGKDQVLSFVKIWPSRKMRLENAKRWEDFWKKGREEHLKTMLAASGSRYGFSKDAFAPFFEDLYPSPAVLAGRDRPAILDLVLKKYVMKQPQGYQMLMFFPDTEANVQLLRPLEQGPNVFVVSRKMFTLTLSHAVSSEAFQWAFLVILFIPLITFVFLRDIRLVLLALVPVLTSMLSVFASLSFLKMPVNVPVLIALLVLAGLAIDYGIFMVYQCRYQLKTRTDYAVSLSAWTTIFGAGALIFARHPVLFSIGLTLTMGVFTGYLSSLFVIPPLYQYWMGHGRSAIKERS
ncbi:MAG: hypothetical protein V1882_05820 [Candidatus Omnitrophota bacterium]